MAYRSDTLCGIFHNQALRYADSYPFLMGKYDNEGRSVDTYQSISWKHARDEVIALSRGLKHLGIERGETVIIFSESRPRWIIADQAIQACGAVVVPLYPTISSRDLAYMIADSEARVIIVSTREKAQQVIQDSKADTALENLQIILMGPWEGKRPDNVYTFSEIKNLGKDTVDIQSVEDSIQRVIPEDIATIIYTSGTTGQPKGVVLTQSNWVANMLQCANSQIMKREKELDLHLISLVYLPLCHVYARTSDYHVSGLYLGGILAFAQNYQTIAKDLKEIRPNIITSIPRLFEKIYDTIQGNISRQKGMYQKLFRWAIKQGRLYSESLATGNRISPIALLEFALANMLVFSKIKKIIGMDRLVIALSGGGKLSKEVCAFFRSMGVQLNEGYGLTETCPVINFNEPNLLHTKEHGPILKLIYDKVLDMGLDLMVIKQSQGVSPYKNPFNAIKLILSYYLLLYKMRIKPGTVGRPVIWTQEKLAPDGEILVKGPQVFKEYWKKPEATAEAFTEDGWFRTGDVGMFDNDGFLIITDRKKELFVTSGGKNIAPHPIEVDLISRPFIDQVCIVGDARKYLTALIIPDFKEISRWAKDRDIEFETIEELVKMPEIKKLIKSQVDHLNNTLARFEQIQYFTILDRPFSEETGELTPTMKVKRRIVYKKYQPQIEAMYRKQV